MKSGTRRRSRRRTCHEQFLEWMDYRSYRSQHPGLLLADLVDHAQSGRRSRTRRRHRSHLGWRPAGVQQPAAALVAVAVLHHPVLCRGLPCPVPRPRQVRGFPRLDVARQPVPGRNGQGRGKVRPDLQAVCRSSGDGPGGQARVPGSTGNGQAPVPDLLHAVSWFGCRRIARLPQPDRR